MCERHPELGDENDPLGLQRFLDAKVKIMRTAILSTHSPADGKLNYIYNPVVQGDGRQLCSILTKNERSKAMGILMNSYIDNVDEETRAAIGLLIGSFVQIDLMEGGDECEAEGS